MSLIVLLMFALAGLILGETCVENPACQDSLYMATSRLQSADYRGYCRHSETYVSCLEAALTGCNTTTPNLLNHTRNTQAVYCASGNNPGYQECLSRHSACLAIYDRFQAGPSNTACSALEQYVVCVLRDLSPCHQSVFNVTSMTLALNDSVSLSCRRETGNTSCAGQYITCQTTSLLVTQSLEEKKWDDFCSYADAFLACRRSLQDDCDDIYTTATALTLPGEVVTNDKAMYCSPDGSSPSYLSCLTKLKSCESRLYITGDIDNTVVLYYCRSLVDYRACLSQDLAACQQDTISLPSLLASATANFTRTCSGININAGVREMSCSSTMLLLLVTWVVLLCRS
ncbi:uncharacterized protein LOC125372324 [Haliotis rufescens]|uniref:uncharacterized protein LOC125372324 n=1 Tax=Haliotis rufescens TaxID=6454 RepID=UPI00201EA949|nr:uncharacterized protein LOC125372324 [Haliotis rufescens]